MKSVYATMQAVDRRHRELLGEIKRKRGKVDPKFSPEGYLGTPHKYYWIKTAQKRELVKGFCERHKDMTARELVALLDDLYRGESYEEKTLASGILKHFKETRAKIALRRIEVWLGKLVGWAEIDILCQNIFTAEEMLDDWVRWKKLIEKLSVSRNISRRRASLVLLTSVVRKNSDKRLRKLAFKMIDRLKGEREILITKAISWLLRDLTYLSRSQVEAYLRKNEEVLPRIAVRETRRKLETGRK